MADIETAYNQELDADVLCEQEPSDHIVSQLALATMMLRLEVDLLTFVRNLNAAAANKAPIEQPSDRPFARLLQGFATMNIRFPWQPPHHRVQHSPA
jgi:hypothetical protein